MKKRELERMIKEVFKYYGKNLLTEDEFFEYFMKKGMNKDEIEELWSSAHTEGLIDVGLISIFDEENPLKTKDKIAFELKRERNNPRI